MSYILDALRKSETERRQGRVPDLGQQVQLIHRSRKKAVSPVVWVALALVLNAAVLGVIFWPGQQSPPTANEPGVEPTVAGPAEQTAPAPEVAPPSPEPAPEEPAAAAAPAEVEASARERATIIVPSSMPPRGNPVLPETGAGGRVPHLVELPLSFQKSVPDLTFNSHIYASDPSARRVMINDTYLRRGDSFSGLRVERITEDGVVLSKQGTRFRVGIVRDWVSPR